MRWNAERHERIGSERYQAQYLPLESWVDRASNGIGDGLEVHAGACRSDCLDPSHEATGPRL